MDRLDSHCNCCIPIRSIFSKKRLVTRTSCFLLSDFPRLVGSWVLQDFLYKEKFSRPKTTTRRVGASFAMYGMKNIISGICLSCGWTTSSNRHFKVETPRWINRRDVSRSWQIKNENTGGAYTTKYYKKRLALCLPSSSPPTSPSCCFNWSVSKLPKTNPYISGWWTAYVLPRSTPSVPRVC